MFQFGVLVHNLRPKSSRSHLDISLFMWPQQDLMRHGVSIFFSVSKLTLNDKCSQLLNMTSAHIVAGVFFSCGTCPVHLVNLFGAT